MHTNFAQIALGSRFSKELGTESWLYVMQVVGTLQTSNSGAVPTRLTIGFQS